MRAHSTNKRQGGFSLIEMVASLMVFSVGILGAYTAFDDGQRLSALSQKVVENDSTTRGMLGELGLLIEESKGDSVDTMARTGSGFYGYRADRFFFSNMGLHRCQDTLCPFHTMPNGDVQQTHLNLSQNLYRMSGNNHKSTRGYQWPQSEWTCDLDDSTLSATSMLDAMRLLSARDPQGNFVRNGDGHAQWNTMIWVAPQPAPNNGVPDLCKYVLSVDDILAQSVTASSLYGEFDPASFSMIDLFDFGDDGGRTGVRDGHIPTTRATRDCHQEWFMPGTSNGETVIYWTKKLNDPGDIPHRYSSVQIELRTGKITWHIVHEPATGERFEAYGNVTRPPDVLIPNITDLAISNKETYPHDPLVNPGGVSAEHAIRITVATTSSYIARGDRHWLKHVDSASITPRN